MINRPTELKINQPNQPTTNPPTNIMKSNLESLGNGAGVTVPVEVWAQMQQFMATFGPLGTIAPPVAPPLASIAASVTPSAPIAPGLAPIDPVVLALPDMITSQSGPINPPPAVAPSDSFSDHATESDHSPSDPMALTFNGNEEKDNFSLNEVVLYTTEPTPRKDSSIQPAQDLVPITATQDVVTNFDEYDFSIGSKCFSLYLFDSMMN
ncbi:hypothetical protein MJO29_008919 [Puccinia striiformis f. sp. tritici]|nr:hypothetical protein MJO29_008919 [Puccinia striiformis f. sp. tritici]